MKQQVFYARSINDLNDTAAQLLRQMDKPSVVALYGGMGAGKTTLVIALCKQLNLQDTVTSPTFSLINEYQADDGKVVYHMDFYRLKTAEEAFDAGCEDYFYASCFCFIEWPQIVENMLPENRYEIFIEAKDDGTREIKLLDYFG